MDSQKASQPGPCTHAKYSIIRFFPPPLHRQTAALADLMPYGPAIAEHIILGAQLLPSTPLALLPGSSSLPDAVSCVLPEEQLSALHASVARLEAWFSGLEAGVVPEGFISVTQAVPGVYVFVWVAGWVCLVG